ncbi:lethal (2) giant larvae [Carabus blaptoides fortunei]
MFKFIRAKGPQHSAERQKLQKELFAFRKTLQHGFPHKPTSFAWDPVLRLICIGTATGAVKVFGQPGVEFYGQHQNQESAVTRLVFLPGVGRVVSLCEDNSLHLWEINSSSLVEVKQHALEGKLKKISVICAEQSGKHLLLGTEGGNIYLLDVQTFNISTDIIYQDVVMQNVPEDYKLNPGAVEVIAEQPGQPNTILIGYNRGLMVLWNRTDNTAAQTFISTQQLESVCWHEDGEQFTSSHNDGSYATWDIDNGERPLSEPTTTYGPFPCKAVGKIIRKQLRDEQLLVFSGGMPRASYSDKYTVSVIHGEQHVAFEFTSKVIDFFVVCNKPQAANSSEDITTSDNSPNEPEALLVLAEEELVALDLQSDDWRMMNLPYLVSLHASAVTCSQHVAGVSEELWDKIKAAGEGQISNIYSQNPWPIDGGALLCNKGAHAAPRRELLLTGHEDGTVRFWDAGSVTLTPLYKYSTAPLFTGEHLEDHTPSTEDEEEWPPFRKTGVFDPYSDDPRLAVKKVVLCPLSGTLVVAGTAGHVVVAKFGMEHADVELRSTLMNIVSDRDGFVWKGHDQLVVRSEPVQQPCGFQACAMLQLHPPAAVTCCVLQAEWGLVAAGTAHGLALFDYLRQKPVIVKCTLNPNDLSGAGDTPISRRKSFKKSLRESFRRLRKGRSTRRAASPASPSAASSTTSPTGRKLPPSDSDAGAFNPLEAKPVERQIEARPVDDALGSMVRCLYFARSFLVSVQNTTPTLWAGTNNGTVYVFTITVPAGLRRQEEDVTCQLGKEIQLKHRAPVIAIAVLDGSSKPLPEPLEVEHGVSPLADTTQAHRVVIASEEQFKVFTLPSLKPYCKYKLTAHEGARVRRMAFATFTGTHPDTEQPCAEVCLLCLTNMGDCLILSVPELKRQLNAAAIRREDINGISSLTFTKDGEALYLHSSSELQRITLAVHKQTSTHCYLQLPAGARAETTAAGEIVGKVQGNEVQQDSQSTATPAPLVNGNADSKESSLADKTEDVRENGDDTPHDVTVSSSIGDITIDSVKDHLATASEELSNRLSGVQLNASGQSVIVKTTTTTISSSSSAGAAAEVTSSTVTTTRQQAETN